MLKTEIDPAQILLQMAYGAKHKDQKKKKKKKKTGGRVGSVLQEVCFRKYATGSVLQEVCFRKYVTGSVL
jgi:hypothetical protein